MTLINWQSDESHIFMNPRMPVFEKNKLEGMIDDVKLKGHIFLATSGSTAIESSDIKWVALKKSAFLISAQSVNQHLSCNEKDVFLNTLPHFHVGGLSLFARAQLCGASVVDIYEDNLRWNPKHFVNQIEHNKVTITSLVPTQIYDIIQNNLHAPVTLKAVVIGGGFLDNNLFSQAQNLNWPLLPSYGMTECCSQIATAEFNFEWFSHVPELTILPHVNVTLSPEGRVEIKSESLLTGYILQSQNKIEFINPKVDDKIITNDVGELKNNKLLIYGRQDENVKIKGENVSLIRLQSLLQQVFDANFDCAIISVPETRKGQEINVVFHERHRKQINEIQKGVEKFNELVYPFEQIEKMHFLEEIPRTELGKLRRNAMVERVKLN